MEDEEGNKRFFFVCAMADTIRQMVHANCAGPPHMDSLVGVIRVFRVIGAIGVISVIGVTGVIGVQFEYSE